MAQVFGNRILGGVGAPGGGMAEAFGAGVNTTLGQRVNRQAMDVNTQNMAIQRQELAWKEEDRKIAAQQRAAATAAASAAKAKAAAFNAELMKIYSGNVPSTASVGGLNMTAAPAAARDRQGSSAPTTAARPAAPTTARPAGVRVPASPALSFGGGTVAGGGGTAALPGGPGSDRLDVTPAPRDRQPVSVTPAPSSGLDYNSIIANAQQGLRPTYTQLIKAADAGLLNNQQALDIQAMIDDPTYTPSVQEQSVAQRPGVTPTAAVYVPAPLREAVTDWAAGVFGGRTLGEQTAVEAARAAALEAQGAGPVAAAPTPTPKPTSGAVEVTMPDGSKLPLSLGTANPVQPTQLGFGPQLGAMPQTQEDIAIDAFVSATGVDLNAAAPPAPPRMGQPGQPNRAITTLMAQRDQQAQLTQLLISNGRYDEARAVQAEIMGIDTKLEAAVARLALNEATMFNAPQRLSAVWSDFTGQQYEFMPAANGGLDVYVNGEQMDTGLSMDIIEQNTLMMTDQAFAAQQAELAALRATKDVENMSKADANVYEYQQKAVIDIQKASQVGMDSIELDLIKRDLGFGERDKIDFQKDDQSGIVLVFKNDKLAAQYAPTEITPEGGTPYVSFQQIQ